MSGLMKKFSNILGFEAEEDDDDIMDGDQVSVDQEPQTDYKTYGGSPTYGASKKNIYPISGASSASVKIEVYQPKTFNDAVGIVDCLRSKKPVVVNLEAVDQEVARKIFDFLNGALYAIDGKAEKVARGIFLMAPNNVEIKGRIQDQEGDHLDSEDSNVSFFKYE